MNEKDKNMASIIGKLGKDTETLEAEVIQQWYDETDNDWKTYNVERKQAEGLETLLNIIFSGWKNSARIKAWKTRKPIYNDKKMKIGYIITPPDKNFDNQDRYYNERLMVIFYKSKYDYFEVD